MNIASLKTDCYRIPLPRVLSDATHGELPAFQLVTVRLCDSDGEEGLGYTYTVGYGGLAVRSLIEFELAPLILSAGTVNTEMLWQQMWLRLHYVGRGGPASFAISAVDIALWDLKARRQDAPLWKLLGGTENRVSVYAGGIDLEFTDSELIEQTERFLSEGFRAIKMKVGRRTLQEDVHRVAMMRDRFGSEINLMADANMAWSVEQAIEAAREFQPFDLYWLEEPIAPDDFAGHERLAGEMDIPIASGENLHTEREFEQLISSVGVAFPEPDVANIGGVTAWLRIAEFARHHGLPVTSHGVHDLHVHLLAAVPNSSYLEYHGFGLERFMKDHLTISDGKAIAPERPGHGVQLDWNALEEYREQ